MSVSVQVAGRMVKALGSVVVGSAFSCILMSTSTWAFVPRTTVRAVVSETRRGATCYRSPGPEACTAAATTSLPLVDHEESAGTRADFMSKATSAVAAAAMGVAALPRTSYAEVFSDDVMGFKFETPEGWARGDAQISGRRTVIVFTTADNPGANAFVAYTPVRGDFTSLGSFGTLDEVSKTILPEGEGVTSRMVDSYTADRSYVYDYIVTQDGRPEKHIKGQLVTITAQANEADYGKLGKAVDKIIASVKKT